MIKSYAVAADFNMSLFISACQVRGVRFTASSDADCTNGDASMAAGLLLVELWTESIAPTDRPGRAALADLNAAKLAVDAAVAEQAQ